MINKEVVDNIITEARKKIVDATGIHHKVYAYPLYPVRDSYEDKATDLILKALVILEIEPEWIIVPDKKERRPIVRQVLSYITLKKYPKVKLGHIAKMIGVTHHSSVLHGRDTATDLLSIKDAQFLSFYNKVKYLLDEGV